MIVRRTFVLGGAATCSVAACGGPVVAGGVGAVAELATGAANVLTAVYAFQWVAGIITGRPTPVAAGVVDLGIRTAERVEAGADTAADRAARAAESELLGGPDDVRTLPFEGDTLGPIGQAYDIHAFARFDGPPILADGQEVGGAWLMPVAWDSLGAVYLGSRWWVPVDHFQSERQSLYAPDFHPARFAKPGLYRMGFAVAFEDYEAPQLYAGGPIMHVFDDAIWNYSRLSNKYDATPAHDFVELQTTYLAPSQDGDLSRRAFKG